MSEAESGAITEQTTTTQAAPSDGAVSISGTETQATPAASASAASTGTIATAPVEDKPVAVTATWPDDWRQKLAGEDKAYLKTLERFPDPTALAKSYRELQARVSSGQVKPVLKADASPEEMATWRRENGIPEAPDGYKPELPDGLIIGEAEKPLVAEFAKSAHAANMTAEQFNNTLAWYYKQQDALQAQQYEADTAFRSKTEDALRAEWGPAYRAEVNGINNFVTGHFGSDLANAMAGARMPDGTLLGNHPEYLARMAALVREVNPMASVVPAGTSDPIKAGNARIAEIEGIMRSDQQTYWKSPDLQKELSDLYAAREAQKNRAA